MRIYKILLKVESLSVNIRRMAKGNLIYHLVYIPDISGIYIVYSQTIRNRNITIILMIKYPIYFLDNCRFFNIVETLIPSL